MASSWPPKKNTEFTLDFTLYKNDGTVIANPGTYTKKISKDGGAVANITASVTEKDTTYGQLSIVLSATEMNADRIWIQIKDDTTGCVPHTVTIYTAGETLDEVKAETAAILADTGTDGVVVASGSKTGYALTSAYDAAKSAASQSSMDEFGYIVGTNLNAKVGDIKAKTDNLPDSPAAVGSAMTLTSAYDAAKTAAAAGAAMTLTAAYDAAKTAAAAGAKMDLVDAPNATAVTAIQSGLATAAALDAVDNFVDTEVGAIKAVTDKLDTALELDGAVYRYTTNALEQAPTGGSAPTAADIADAVWDEALEGHADSGSAGAGLTAAGSAGDPWATALPGSYGAGTAGLLLGTTIPAAIDAVDNYVDTEIGAIATTIGAAGAGLTAVPWNAAWDAEVQSECTDALNAYDPPTKTEMDSAIAGGDDAVLARLGTPAGASVSADLADIEGKVDDLEGRLTATRAGYLDNLATAPPTAAEIKTAIEAAGSSLAAILEDTGTTLDGKINTIDDFLDTEIAAILADTTLIEKWILDKLVGTDNGDGTVTYVLYDTDGTTPLKTWVHTTASGTRAAAT